MRATNFASRTPRARLPPDAPLVLPRRRRRPAVAHRGRRAVGIGAASRRPSRAAVRPCQADDAPDVVTYGRRDDVMRFAAEVAERRGIDAAWVRGRARRARYHAQRGALHHAAAGRARRRTGPPTAPASSSRRASAPALALLARQRELAGPGRGDLRRAAGDRRRHHRRGDALRPADRQLPRDRRAGDAGVRLSAGPQGPQRLLPRRAREVLRDVPAARASSRSRCRAATPAPSACRSSCRRASTSTPSTSTATAASTCAPAPPTRSAASPTTWRSSAGSAACRPASTVVPPADPAERAVLLAPDIVPQFTPAEFTARGARLGDAGLDDRRHRSPWSSCTTATTAAELRRRHHQLLRGHALQLVELLRAGGDRAGRGGGARARCGGR